MRRFLALSLILALSAGATPVAVAADNQPPIAVDDPAIPGCNSTDQWGGAFPIPEDWIGNDPQFPGWFALFGSCGPLANDSDPDGDPLTFELIGQPAHGEAESLPDGFLAYRADPDYSTPAGDLPGGTWVSDTITYRISDGQAWSDTASYRVWIAPINDPPSFTSGPDVEARMGDGPVSVPWASNIAAGPPNELAQAVSFELSVDSAGAPGMFAVAPVIDSEGVLHFTPGSEPGLATVTVRAKDDGGLEDYPVGGGFEPPDDTSDAVEFTIVVWPALPAAPVAGDDELVVAEDEVVDLEVLANDDDVNDDPLQVSDVTAPAKGGAALVALPGTIRYTPLANATGTDSFSYTIEDGTGRSDLATVNVTITPVNDPPVADDDVAAVAQGVATTIPVLDGDDDVDGDALLVLAASGAAHGTLSAVAGGVRYTPVPGYSGPDTFTYTVSDGIGGTDTGVVAVTVVPDTAAPVFAPLSRNLPAQAIGSSTVQVRLAWGATDLGSGLASYQLQEQVNDGSWRSVPLSSPTTRAAIRTVTIGTAYRYRVRATDRAGNVTPWKAWPVFVARRSQESSSSIAWSGSWTRVLDSRYSGAATRRTAGSGRRATFAFSGRTVGWVATRSTSGGRAQVRIDGVLVATVDLDAPTGSYRRLAFAAQVVAGSHRIEIRPLGDGWVDVDAFIVLP